jgi:Fe2+ transport system protein B
MSIAQQQQRPPIDIAALAAALGSNIVPFVPPPREEPQATDTEWAEGLDLIDQAAAFMRSTEQRAQVAEERAEKVAFKAMEGLRTAQLRFEQAEAQARDTEQRAAEDIRLAQGRMAEAEAWAQAAEERARAAESRMEEAESRMEAAEARARTAEEWLRCLTDALKQKLSFGPQPEFAEEARPLLKRRAG